MIHKTHPTKSKEYWIHTDGEGFSFFADRNHLVGWVFSNFVRDKFMGYSNYQQNFGFGIHSLNHKKNTNEITYNRFLQYDTRDIESITIPFVISHDISADIIALRKKNNKYVYRKTKKHTKGYSFRRMSTFQEKKMFDSSLTDAAWLRDEHDIILKNTRHKNSIPDTWDDIYWQSDNNWKNSRKYKKQWVKNSI